MTIQKISTYTSKNLKFNVFVGLKLVLRGMKVCACGDNFIYNVCYLLNAYLCKFRNKIIQELQCFDVAQGGRNSTTERILLKLQVHKAFQIAKG